MKIFGIEFGWCWVAQKSKSYINITGEFESKVQYSFSINKWDELDEKRWGYNQTWYDGPFHSFSLGIITLHWSSRGFIIKDLKTGKVYEK